MENTAQVNEKSVNRSLIIVIEVFSNSTNFYFQLFHLLVCHLVVQTLFARRTPDPLCVYVMLVIKAMDTTVQVCVRCQATFFAMERHCCNVTV